MDLDQTQTPSTTANDHSFGPALIGSSSLDSPAIINLDNNDTTNRETIDNQPIRLSQEARTVINEETEPRVATPVDNTKDDNDNDKDENVSRRISMDMDLVADGEPVDTVSPESTEPNAIQVGPEPRAAPLVDLTNIETKASGDIPLPRQSNSMDASDFENNFGASRNEAELYADDLAREVLNDSNHLVRDGHSEIPTTDSVEAENVVEQLAVDKAVTTGEQTNGTVLNLANVEEQEEIKEEDEKEEREEEEDQHEKKANIDLDNEEELKIEPQHTMEFTKNYSDELLMGASGERKQQSRQDELHNQGSHDLADFELPPYSGSSGSSASEQAPASTSNIVADNVASSSTDLTAIKNILISSYSKFSHVFHWKKPIESGIFLGIGLTLITALTFFSIISVFAYSALGIISISGLIRVYKASMKALSRSQETPMDHIWDLALNLNLTISPETMHKLVDASHGNLNASLTYFKQVLLVEDKLATFKFAFFLYLLTYIGSWFNGLTLITITYLSLFTVPLFYEKNKTKIDEQVNMATSQISSALSMFTTKASTLVFGTQSAGASKKQN